MLVGRTSVLCVGAVLDVVQFTSTSTTDVTFARFATTSITYGVLDWAIAKEMPWLYLFYVRN